MANFLVRALIKQQLKGMSESEIDKLVTLFEKNPDFFKKMAETIQEKVKGGMSQEEAAKAFAEENKEGLMKVLK